MKTPAPFQHQSHEDKGPGPRASFSSTDHTEPPSHPAPESSPASAAGARLSSLDAFRGLTIALMIIVNSHGDIGTVYSPLSHMDWDGWTFADTVFPSFLFIVGVSLVFSFTKREEKYMSNWALAVRILRRTVVLFALGIFVNTFPDFELSTVRIPGVLQRIALCYLFASLILLKTGWRGTALWLICLLVSYWLMMRFIPVPGLGAGVMEPGQNFAAWVDSHLLSGHMWSYYDGKWDPEGIVSTIPAIATTLFGVLTGQWLKSGASEKRKVAAMACAGLILLVAGQVLDRWLPINKSLWTSTFAIFMAGMALVCLAFFYWLIDIANLTRWAKPFIILGLNPITIYVLSIVTDTILRATNLIASNGSDIECPFTLFRICLPISSSEVVSLLYASVVLIFMFLLAWIMWRRRIFIKV